MEEDLNLKVEKDNANIRTEVRKDVSKIDSDIQMVHLSHINDFESIREV